MKTLIRIAAVLLAITSTMFSQAVGDYGSAASGNWGTAATWVVCVTPGTWTGATVAAAVPTAATNIWVRTGHTVTVEASPKTCLNITVDSGGVLTSGQPTTTNRYIRVSGSTVTVNGTFGGAADGLGLEPYASVTFTGNGTFRPCRVRTGASISNITVTFDINTTFTYTGSSGTGGAGLYAYNSGTTDNITFTVNAGKTVSAVNFCNIATSSSTSVDAACSTVFNINGTLSMPGANSNFSLRTAAGKTCALNVNGLVEVGNNFLPTSFTTATSTTTVINAGGEIKVGVGGGGTCDLDSAVVSGAGTFTLMSGSTITIGSPSGLEPAAGPVRTTTRNFNSGAKYAFVGTAAQVTGSDLPSTVHTLTVNNASGVTLTNSVSVDTSLTFSGGKLITGVNTVTSKFAVNSAGAGKFVEGNLAIPVKSASMISWKVGQNADYLPLTAAFNTVTGTDKITVAALDKTVKAPNGSYTAADKVLRRYYHVTKGAGVSAFTIDSLTVSYSNADVVEQGITDETVLHVYKHDGTTLSEATVAFRDTAANTITVTGVSAVSDFIISGSVINPLVPPVLPLDFESASVDYSFTNFSGATTTKIANPQSSGINTSGFVAKTIKGAGDPWAGSYLTLSAPVDLTKGKIFKAKVFMPKVGARMLLKLEHLSNGAINKEIDAVATKANEWEELTWDFSAIDATKDYQKVVVIFDLGTVGDGGANFTYLFDDIKQVAAPAVVTFQVNMKVQAKLKKFNPAKDTVVMRGNFYQGSGNWWDANDQKLTDPDGDSIYVGSFSVGTAPKRLGQYKFVMRGPDVSGDRWEADMGVNKDRTDTIPSLPWTLPVVWFSNDSTSKYSDNFITFQVNMKKQMKFSKFNKTSDSVVVRGDFNGWAGNSNVLTDPNADSIYTATLNITSVSKIIYKFVIHKASGDTWESSKDRVDSLLNGTPRTEPVVFFENDSILTGVRRDESAVVKEYALGQNYPNPFNPATKIDFSLLASSRVTLKIYNVVGQEVATVVDQQLEAGKHIATFNASQLTSGVYFYKLEAGAFTSIKKMMLLK